MSGFGIASEKVPTLRRKVDKTAEEEEVGLVEEKKEEAKEEPKKKEEKVEEQPKVEENKPEEKCCECCCDDDPVVLEPLQDNSWKINTRDLKDRKLMFKYRLVIKKNSKKSRKLKY